VRLEATRERRTETPRFRTVAASQWSFGDGDARAAGASPMFDEGSDRKPFDPSLKALVRARAREA
jgi:hypothetical protein